MSKRDASDTAAAADKSGPAAKTVGTDRWAKAVVDGVPVDPAPAPAPADAADPGTPDDPAESWWVDEADETGSEDPLDADGAGGSDQGAGESPGSDGADANDPTNATDEETPAGEISVEDLVIDLERVTIERDQYLDASRRLQAEFENYKKQVLKREIEARERANDSLVGELLPVLDAFDGAVANGAEDVAPMRATFLEAMSKHGLERIDPTGVAFDPTLHEAVMHEEASDTDGPVVAEVMRAGYVWKGRVLRPAMVRTRG